MIDLFTRDEPLGGAFVVPPTKAAAAAGDGQLWVCRSRGLAFVALPRRTLDAIPDGYAAPNAELAGRDARRNAFTGCGQGLR